MKNVKWMRMILLFLFAGAFAAPYFISDIKLAMVKPLNTDEGQELVHEACNQSVGSLLLNGADGECSPQPLYYILQRLHVRHSGLPVYAAFGAYRILSIAFSVGVVTAVLTLTGYYAGPVWGVIAGSIVVGQQIFHIFAAENRPYMMWVLALLAMLIGSSERKLTWFLGMMLTLVSGAGALQASMIVFVVGLFERKFKPAILMVASFVAVGAWYSRHACTYPPGGPLDLLYTHDIGLIKTVLELFWAPTTLFTIPLNLFLLAGIVRGVRAFSKTILGKETDPLDRLAAQVTAQLPVVVMLGALVAIKHYFFIQRMFIYLPVLRALLVVAGGDLIFKNRLGFIPKKPILTWIVAVAIAVVYVPRVRARIEPIYQDQLGHNKRWFSKVPCELLSGTVEPWMNPGIPFDDLVNGVVAVARRKAACNLPENGPKTALFLEVMADTVNATPLDPKRNTSATRVVHCGKLITF